MNSSLSEKQESSEKQSVWEERALDNGAGIALIVINNVLEKKSRMCSRSWSSSFKSKEEKPWTIDADQ